MLEECHFSNGVRGKYAERFAKGANVVVLDPDVSGIPRSESVNQALRALAVIIRKRVAESRNEVKARSNKRLERTRR